MKNRIIFIIIALCPLYGICQEWQSSSEGIYYNSGQVGIGVLPLHGKFTVNDPGISQVRVENDLPGGEPTIRLRARTADNSHWLHADIGIFSTSNSSEVGFLGFKVPYNNTFGEGYKMVINSSGKVGIGTTSLSETLEIGENGGTNTNFVRINSDDSQDAGIKLSTGNADYVKTAIIADGLGSYHRADLHFVVNSAADHSNYTLGTDTKMLIQGRTGHIGIGTTSPGQRLTVQGVIRSQRSSSNYVNNFFVSGDGNCYMNYAGGSTSSRIGFQVDGGSKVSIYNNGNFVVHSGNLGIGYNDPKHKLSVAGTISATEVKVSTTPNSDFVFEPEYQLRPLEEVDAFIRENKHLPDIPSAAEFKENGVGLGEMDNMLLQKIEELTLYVIEQKKELIELRKENNRQAERLKKLEDINKGKETIK
jgi:hypothetical protein